MKRLLLVAVLLVLLAVTVAYADNVQAGEFVLLTIAKAPVQIAVDVPQTVTTQEPPIVIKDPNIEFRVLGSFGSAAGPGGEITYRLLRFAPNSAYYLWVDGGAAYISESFCWFIGASTNLPLSEAIGGVDGRIGLAWDFTRGQLAVVVSTPLKF